MRIISGTNRGLKLKAVPGKNTRPTSDKVKESLFNMIGPYFSGGTCLDLFAGSGSLGLEAISRGIEHATFIDKNGLAIKTIHDNIHKLRAEDKTEVIRVDALRGLQLLSEKDIAYSLIFIDPPYEVRNINNYLKEITKNKLLAKNGLIIYEHLSTNDTIYNESLSIVKEAKYGHTQITIFNMPSYKS